MRGRPQVFPLDGIFTSDRDSACRLLVGSRGALLAQLHQWGFPVPPGFVISAEVGRQWSGSGSRVSSRLWEEIRQHLRRLIGPDGARWGSADCPLLLSVQADLPQATGARPAPLTCLGLCDRWLEGWAQRAGSRRAAWVTYGRLLRQFGVAVLGIPAEDFIGVRQALLAKYNASGDHELDESRLQELCDLYKRVYFERTEHAFPQDPLEQLRLALASVFGRTARPGEENGAIGVPVLVTVAVCGHLEQPSGVVRAASRDGDSGEMRPVGHYLLRADEDELDPPDRRALKPLENLPREGEPWAQIHDRIVELLTDLEARWQDPREAVFVVERGHLWITQVSAAPRCGSAAVRWAIERVQRRPPKSGRSGDYAEAPLRHLEPEHVRSFLQARPRTPRRSRLPTLVEALRRGPQEARRHPDFGWFRVLNEWCRRHVRWGVWAEARDLVDIVLARAMAADGVVYRVDRLVGSDRLVNPRDLEAVHSAARGLPLLLELDAKGLQAAAIRAWLSSAPRFRVPDTARPWVMWDLPADGKPTPAFSVDPSEAQARMPQGYRIATPRAALLADLLADEAAFLWFDLPQVAAACRGESTLNGSAVPFDVRGAGQLIEWVVQRVRKTRHDVKLLARGIAADDLPALRFLGRLGFEAVVVPADEVLVMRVALAQMASG